jgi:hypothetical protein
MLFVDQAKLEASFRIPESTLNKLRVMFFTGISESKVLRFCGDHAYAEPTRSGWYRIIAEDTEKLDYAVENLIEMHRKFDEQRSREIRDLIHADDPQEEVAPIQKEPPAVVVPEYRGRNFFFRGKNKLAATSQVRPQRPQFSTAPKPASSTIKLQDLAQKFNSKFHRS